jgi:hypothetical protein
MFKKPVANLRIGWLSANGMVPLLVRRDFQRFGGGANTDRLYPSQGKGGQVQFVQSTLRAVPANWTCPPFPISWIPTGATASRCITDDWPEETEGLFGPRIIGLDLGCSPGSNRTIWQKMTHSIPVAGGAGGKRGQVQFVCKAPSGPFRQIGPVPFFPHPPSLIRATCSGS